jgi:hypothetical protein
MGLVDLSIEIKNIYCIISIKKEVFVLREYVPSGPFEVTIGEGENIRTTTVEELLLENPRLLLSLLEEERKKQQKVSVEFDFFSMFISEKTEEKNKVQDSFLLHTKWAIAAAGEMKPVMFCLQCGIRPVRYFRARNNKKEKFSAKTEFASCERKECREKVFRMTSEKTSLYPLSWNTLLFFSTEEGRKKVSTLLKYAIFLKGQVTPDEIFNRLKNPL